MYYTGKYGTGRRAEEVEELRTKLKDRTLPSYTRGEEMLNMISHIAGGIMGVAATVLCVVTAVLHHSVWGVVSGAIFGGTMILLYTMSSIYHGLSPEKMAKKVFQIIDHCSIFLLIAGTYTPLTLCTLRIASPGFGWTIFGLIWAMAVLGIVLNAIDLKQFHLFSIICYLVMGWCIVIAAKPVVTGLGLAGTWMLLIGGIAYTIGAVFYVFGRRHAYIHSVFHVFVVAGSFFHFLCILLYVM